MENNGVTQTQEEMVKGIQATVKVARWIYEAAVDEGFNQEHAFAMSLSYFTGLLNQPKGKNK